MEMNFTKSYLADVFPLNGVLDGAVVSKKGDITFAWKLSLPAITTQGESAYDAMIGRLSAAIRNLPPYTIVHKQDSFLYRKYNPMKGILTAGYIFATNAAPSLHSRRRMRCGILPYRRPSSA